MYTGLVHLHNLLRWVIVITLILSLINAFKGKNGKESKESFSHRTPPSDSSSSRKGLKTRMR